METSADFTSNLHKNFHFPLLKKKQDTNRVNVIKLTYAMDRWSKIPESKTLVFGSGIIFYNTNRQTFVCLLN